MKRILFVFPFLIGVFAFAQNESKTPNHSDSTGFVKDLFSEEQPVKISLKTDLKKLKKEKFNGNYQPAEITYIVGNKKIAKKIKIKPRGNNRRENCYIPPIAIKLKNLQESKNTPKRYKTKLVLYCKQAKIYEKYVLKEYLCYQLYSVLNKYSFRVQLLDLTIIDTGTKNEKQDKTLAFIIEPNKMMAKRLDANLEKNKNLTQQFMNQEHIMELAMFQFMIGNFDWGVPTQQNVKLIRPKISPNDIYAVPYDFDYCGFVNASYAIPNEALNIGTVRERLYLGECKTEKEINLVIEKFLQYKNPFFKVINDFEYLEERDKTVLIKYLESFYKILESGKFYKNYHQKTCKKIGKK